MNHKIKSYFWEYFAVVIGTVAIVFSMVGALIVSPWFNISIVAMAAIVAASLDKISQGV